MLVGLQKDGEHLQKCHSFRPWEVYLPRSTGLLGHSQSFFVQRVLQGERGLSCSPGGGILDLKWCWFPRQLMSARLALQKLRFLCSFHFTVRSASLGLSAALAFLQFNSEHRSGQRLHITFCILYNSYNINIWFYSLITVYHKCQQNHVNTFNDHRLIFSWLILQK